MLPFITIELTKNYGTVSVYYYKDDPTIGYISSLRVDEKLRNKGLGTKLLKEAEKVCKLFKTTILLVDNSLWMYNWYSSIGYVPIGIDDDPKFTWMQKQRN